MKTFTIEVSAYPQEFIITANNEAEAKIEAEKRFGDKNNGASVYESVIIDTQEL